MIDLEKVPVHDLAQHFINIAVYRDFVRQMEERLSNLFGEVYTNLNGGLEAKVYFNEDGTLNVYVSHHWYCYGESGEDIVVYDLVLRACDYEKWKDIIAKDREDKIQRDKIEREKNEKLRLANDLEAARRNYERLRDKLENAQ